VDSPRPNVGLLTNIICCRAAISARSPTRNRSRWAEAIQQRFDDLDYLHDIGEIDLNISGCMNACGHHQSAISHSRRRQERRGVVSNRSRRHQG